MKRTQIAITVIIALVVGAGSFYAGMQYAISKTQVAQSGRYGGTFSGANGGQRGGQGQGMRGGQGSGNGGAGDFAGGQIIAKDDSSMTIKTRNGSTQIIFFSATTTIDKSVAGATSDLNVGQQVTVNGKSNPDGTLAAQNIQIRPSQQN